jgi:sulfur-oxidizing protein SoxY
MITRSNIFFPRGLRLFALLCLLPLQGQAAGQQSEVDLWESLLRPRYFEGKPITAGKDLIELRIPLRAEDAGVVPVSIDAKIPQSPERYVEHLYVFVDKNPKPLAGVFHLTPEMGEADLALRLRINQFTKVRAVAVLNTGEIHMDEGYTRASGGCSEPPPFLQLKEARARIGQMKFRTLADKEGDGALGQLIISHPNITGLQLDQRTRAFIPAEYVTRVEIAFNGQHIMTAETDISMSEDPSFRFFFQPRQGGTIEARMTDSEGRSFTHTFDVKPLTPG